MGVFKNVLLHSWGIVSYSYAENISFKNKMPNFCNLVLEILQLHFDPITYLSNQEFIYDLQRQGVEIWETGVKNITF